MSPDRWKLAALALAGVVPLGHAQAASTTIQANAKVVKSLTLTKKQDLDFGTITMSGATGSATVTISIAGTLSCPSGVTCAGTAKQAIMNVSGSKSETIRITVDATNLTNTVDGSTLTYTPIAPATITLTNSGFPGNDFNIGGSIVIPSTADGTYSGNVTVTAEYQ